MGKSADAFRTISEVARILQTPPHVLRFWEARFPQVKPVKRAGGGRRYYRPGDVALLGGIRHLLHDQGLTIRGVQKMLRENGVAHISSLYVPAEATPSEGEPQQAPEEQTDAPASPQEQSAARSAARSAAGEASVCPFPTSPRHTHQPSLFPEDNAPDKPDMITDMITGTIREEDAPEAPIVLDMEPEPPAQVTPPIIDRPHPDVQHGLARILANLHALDPDRFGPADLRDLRMIHLRARALHLRLSRPA